jgi:uncharacterized cupredoxin-like copper-binding protein
MQSIRTQLSESIGIEDDIIKRKSLLFAPLLALAAAQAFATGDLSRDNPEEVVIEMGSNANGMYFKPKHLEFETGKAYKIVLKNVDVVKHELETHEFVQRLFSRKVEINNPDGTLLAEIKGSVSEIEVGPKSEVEWYVVPVQTGKDIVMDCALPGHKEAGMTGTITIN